MINWFKALKMAMPMVDRPRNVTYLDIGHDGYEQSYDGKIYDEQLWSMDNNYKIESVPAEFNLDHSGAFGDSGDYIARGRYDPKTNRVSLSIRKRSSIAMRIWDNPTQMEFFKKRITDALDRKFNNASIIDFTTYRW